MNTARTLISAALALATGAATAHDSWFETLPVAAGGAAVLALGTGNQFPAQETGIEARYLTLRGCRRADLPTPGAAPLALKALRNTPTSLVLQAPRGAGTCWVQLAPFDVEVAPDKVPVYLKEIQASPEIRATWAAMAARGLPWRERYTKHARIELGVPGALPAPIGLDLHIENAASFVRVGTNISVQALRDGQPLPDLALELRSENSPLGIWRRTDAQGRISVAAPLPGRWLLRGVDLRVAAADPDRWDSRFVTLAFDVAPAAAPTSPSPSLSPSLLPSASAAR
jgi:hypothetical protein